MCAAGGDLPAHVRHGLERDPLLVQLGHECYIARHVLRDEESRAAVDAARADGFARLDELGALEHGARVVCRVGKLFSGYEVPTYGAPIEGRIVAAANGRRVLLPKGRRVNGYALEPFSLVKMA